MPKVESKPDVFYEKKEGIATLYFNRPEKRNAFYLGMWNMIGDALEELQEDREVKVLIIRGVDETAFAAGADISEFKTVRYTAEGAKTYNDSVLAVEEKLIHFPKPTIAMIQKYCVGGGLELALACDMRFSSETGLFGITPAKLGIVYNLSPTKNLVDLVGPARAKDILFSGRLLDAKEAYEYGLVERVYADDEIVEKTYEYAKTLTERAQRSIKGSKRIIHEILNGAQDESPEIAQMILDSFESDDYKEGVRAFLEKRKPNFKEV
ncbi:enoyl-CoA hydratase/carnithine racemase [Caldalkalibacillus uzonensis]|uniref:Enoyl-CoA hydratase/carnithine racemase n=1 Tax=Caldalkalibacillus uzonensis TaxID=353224 RepID=A0ABU0CQ19_9BACI|nr:enoyl-CoA hydratase-related protein [Caldalkalibacillus uzonensis]MDQ0338193.1 enoyl-CoA hydratase/carnithine racemase [Caldalkalibacillus uzonensis]